jgi:putative tricarboxylic transport membrane protein
VKRLNIKVKTTMAFTVFGLLYTIAAIVMPKAAIGNPMAPKIFPLVLGIGLTVLGVLYTLKEYKIWQAEVAAGTIKKITPEKQEVENKTNKLIKLTAAAGIGYAAVFEHLGYVISTILFIGIVMFALNGKKKWKTCVIVSVVFSVVVYLIFSNLLAIPLPKIPILDI